MRGLGNGRQPRLMKHPYLLGEVKVALVQIVVKECEN
jgi:hypothetical protein